MNPQVAEGCSAVIVHYGNLNETLEQCHRVLSWSGEVLVVSNDGTPAEALPEELRQSPALRWLVPGRNLGYGGAINYAAGLCCGELVAVLNPDVVVPEDVAMAAVAAAGEAGVGVVGLGMTDAAGRFSSGAGCWDQRTGRKKMNPVRGRRQECDWVTGAAMFIPLAVLREVRFDERYFLGVEDLDFCLRVRDAGYRVVALAGGGTRHIGGTSVGAVRWYYYAFRNPVWLARDRLGPGVARRLRGRFALQAVKTGAVDVVKRRGFGRSRMMFMAVRDAGKLEPEPMSPAYPWEPISVEGSDKRAQPNSTLAG